MRLAVAGVFADGERFGVRRQADDSSAAATMTGSWERGFINIPLYRHSSRAVCLYQTRQSRSASYRLTATRR